MIFSIETSWNFKSEVDFLNYQYAVFSCRDRIFEGAAIMIHLT